MSDFKPITGIILAGGKSSRMGRDKGTVLLHGVPMIEHVLRTLRQVTDSVIIIGPKLIYQNIGCDVFEDIYPENGPLGGIFTALTYSQTERNLVLSCDIPFVDVDTLQIICNHKTEYSIVVPEYLGQVEPLCAIYNKSLLPAVENALKNDELAMRRFVSCMPHENLAFDTTELNPFRNINTADELNQLNAIQ
jgi:molybdopterin-guanine dinucleotide biosynthesis protein A